MASGRVPKRCEGTNKKGELCGGLTFRCSNPECGSVGCEKKDCSDRQFQPIQKCKDCGRSYERIQQFDVAPAPVDVPGADSSRPGVNVALPNVELLFGGLLGLVALAVAALFLSGAFSDRFSNGGGSAAAPPVAPAASTDGYPLASSTFTDVCSCYREGMALAGTGVTVLSSRYRTGFVQCRAVFGPEGGEAWTAGWTAREQGRVVAAGCRSWRRGVGQ